MRTKRIILLSIVVVMVLTLYFFRTPNIAYRTPDSGCRFNELNAGSIAIDDLTDCPSVMNEDRYKLAFIEFDDQGYYHDQRQAFLAFKLLRAVFDQDTPGDIFVFVHGWNNNASPDNSNVEQFRKFLELRAEQSPLRTTTGVYIGWPAETLTGVLGYLTFWSRKAAAHRVASGSLQEFFATLQRDKEDYLKDYDFPAKMVQYEEESAKYLTKKETDYDDKLVLPQRPPDPTRVFIIGHSFGGLIAYQANSQSLALRYGERIVFKPDGQSYTEDPLSIGSLSDLIILINPAIEASRFSVLNALASEYPDEPFEAPKMVVISSVTDWATKLAFPMGRVPSRLFSDQLNAGQRLDSLVTVGNSEKYKTHEAYVAENGQTVICRFNVFGRENNKVLWQAPFWFVSADASLIDGHSDLNGEKLLAFFQSLNSSVKVAPCEEATEN